MATSNDRNGTSTLDLQRFIGSLSTLNGTQSPNSTTSLSTRTAVSAKDLDPSGLSYRCLYEEDNAMSDSLKAIARKYEINKKLARRLSRLRDYEIVVVCDDSGSMKTPVDGTQCTRWDELKKIVQIVLEIGVVFDSNGVDVYFINGRTFPHVKDPFVVDEAFARPPSGYTPLVPVLDKIFRSPLARRGRDKKLLVFVCTDGVPTDEDGNETVPELERLMRETRQSETTYVSFLLCTDDPDCVDYLTEWDRTMTNVDVTDDFHTEKKKIRFCRGDNYRFSFGDYVVKALIGAIDPEIDRIDEPDRINDIELHQM